MINVTTKLVLLALEKLKLNVKDVHLHTSNTKMDVENVMRDVKLVQDLNFLIVTLVRKLNLLIFTIIHV